MASKAAPANASRLSMRNPSERFTATTKLPAMIRNTPAAGKQHSRQILTSKKVFQFDFFGCGQRRPGTNGETSKRPSVKRRLVRHVCPLVAWLRPFDTLMRVSLHDRHLSDAVGRNRPVSADLSTPIDTCPALGPPVTYSSHSLNDPTRIGLLIRGSGVRPSCRANEIMRLARFRNPGFSLSGDRVIAM